MKTPSQRRKQRELDVAVGALVTVYDLARATIMACDRCVRIDRSGDHEGAKSKAMIELLKLGLRSKKILGPPSD